MKGTESSERVDRRLASGGRGPADVSPADVSPADVSPADVGPDEQVGPGSVGRDKPVGPDEGVEERAPDSPSDLPRRSWTAVLRGTLKEFRNDELLDRAASLTYYGILSLFPALLVLVSFLGIAGESAIRHVLDTVDKLAPGAAHDVLGEAVGQLRGNGGTGSLLAVVGLILALWSASGYVGAFIRVANAVYDVPEGRPLWKILPLRLALTVSLMVLAGVSALIVVVTGELARHAGAALGIGDTVMTVWSVVKWPVLVFLVAVMMALLYWAAPNAKGRGFRWVSLGSFLALALWMLASGGFAFYAAHFGSFNRVYGTLAGVIVFLMWLWITNLALLLGLEFDAEVARQRAIAGGHPEDEELYIEPRDTQKWSDAERRRLE
ncbi:YihY/virulence factor BrkB family protein [Streptomyces sp. NPDC013457]|uniref:YihY/virulence factor BrkB family protein n=1 Tax=Streptomyces sp. NPDC013457 TaxID=3364866 RepID=UPI0036FF2CF8